MAWTKVHQIGERSVLRCRDTLYVAFYEAKKRQSIYRPLGTRDLATAKAPVQCLTEHQIDARVVVVR